MKIIVLHGDHIQDSYARLYTFIREAKKRGWRVERISDNAPLTLPEKLTGASLFDSEVLYILEDFSKIKKSELDWLKRRSQNIDATLVIYNQGFINKATLSSLPKPKKIEEFRLPKLIWKFLDSFYPGNADVCLKLLREVIKTEAEEFVFALLAKHLRDIYWVKVDSGTIPYPSWRVGKLQRLSQKFNNGQLKVLISELAKTDIRVKTSKDNLLGALDFLIATHLE